MKTLEDYLILISDNEIREGIKILINSIKDISINLNKSIVSSVGTCNIFGDVQLTVDIISDNILNKYCSDSKIFRAYASEETPELKELSPEGSLVCVWDPLDGSSIVDCNWSVGTIIGVFKLGCKGLCWNGGETLIGANGRQQVASIMALYGPRTSFLISVDAIEGVYEFTKIDDTWILSKEKCTIGTSSKMFSPANMRAAQDLKSYQELLNHWMEFRYTLRYTGGLVPDVYQSFLKGQGVFCNPSSKKAPAKLRVLYECAPIGRLVEEAGGRTSIGKSRKSILDVVFTSMDLRAPVCMGSADEVERFEDHCVFCNDDFSDYLKVI
eukprot:GHVR01132737.1.p1 GENE.GHVR01132737.1~~GHVR01132737.1.p1  ORF type:complete len:326 (+),score=70.86 GHVR01132737.1:57-1034(+)